jgi:hypothetical protein
MSTTDVYFCQSQRVLSTKLSLLDGVDLPVNSLLSLIFGIFKHRMKLFSNFIFFEYNINVLKS